MSVARPWTGQELALLREHAHLGAVAVAAMLDRSTAAVYYVAHVHGISLRRHGEARGRRQSRRVDDRAVLAIRAAAERRPLCPMCVARPVEVPKAGTCQVCYQRELARAHRDEAARREAAKDLDAARQEKHRAGRKVDP